MKLKAPEFFENLQPKTKKYVIGGAVAIGVGLFLYAALGNPEPVKRNKKQNEVIRNILTDKDTRTMSIESLAADLRLSKNTIDQLNTSLKNLESELKKTQDRNTGAAPVIQNEISRLSTEQRSLLSEIEYLKGELAKGPVIQSAPTSGSEVFEQPSDVHNPVDPVAKPNSLEGALGDLSQIFSQPVMDDITPAEQGFKPDGKGENRATVAANQGFEIFEHKETEPIEEGLTQKEIDEKNSTYIPAGSIITGVFLNGLDAPTGQNARRDPFPAAVRIQHEAILPNHFTADIKECFLLISGYGDLSSERAYLRGETLSCVRDDGGVIETKFDSYAVGEDGKAGVRGRLVSKQGQIIAKSAMAGFLSGFAEAFDVDPVPVLATSTTGSTQYQERGLNNNFWQSAGAKGASNAMDRIAEYYIEMAEGIFPVIEIGAGREIDIIVTRGTKLKVKS